MMNSNFGSIGSAHHSSPSAKSDSGRMLLDGLPVLRGGVVVPAHPFALKADGRPDWRAQRALTRYYLAAGADGLAVGVHTTQFELHDDPYLLREVWELAAITSQERDRPTTLVAGVCGSTSEAVAEASIARELGYETALLMPRGADELQENRLIDRLRAVSEVVPVIAFYLQNDVGGRYLSPEFWRSVVEVPGVVGIKIAPFDRYQTMAVVRTVLESDRWADVALLTGNDDSIVADLAMPVEALVNGEVRRRFIDGGLLGQWAIGTRAAVTLVRDLTRAHEEGLVPTSILEGGPRLISINAAVFDPLHRFAGSIAGINEMLRQQGLLSSSRCLSPSERLSPGQHAEITYARLTYGDLLDEEFIQERLDEWLA